MNHQEGIKGQQRAFWKTSAFWSLNSLVLICLVTVCASLYILSNLTGRISNVHIPFLQSVNKVEANISQAHLWFEEAISGDKTVQIDDVQQLLISAQTNADSLLQYQTSFRQNSELSQQQIPALTEQLSSDLETFIAFTNQRWQDAGTSGISTEIDQQYDILYQNILRNINSIDEYARHIISEDMKLYTHIKYLFVVLVIGFILILYGFPVFYMRKHYERETLLESSNIRYRKIQQELRIANQQLYKSRKIYQAVIEDLPALVCRNRPDGTIIFVNDAYCKYFGKTPEELINHDFFDMIVEEDRRFVIESLKSIGVEHPKMTYEHRAFDATGAIRHMRWTNSAICDQGGQVIAIQAFGEDITAQKKAEDELIRARDDWKGIFESITDSVIILDSNHRIVDANQASAELTGLTKEAMLGRYCYEIFHQSTSPPPNCPHEQLLRTGQPSCADMEVEALNQTFMVSISPICDEQGNVLKTIHIAKNITAQKKDRMALMESRRLLNQTGKMACVGGWEHDFQTGQAYWTDALYDIIKIAYDSEPPGVDEHWNYYPPQDRQILEAAYNKCRYEYAPFDLEMRVYTTQGDLIWARVYGEPVLEGDQCVKMRGTFQNISQRKKAEESLLESERKYRLLADNTLDCIWILNMEMEFLYVNPAVKLIAGYTPEEWIGSSLSNYTDPQDYRDMLTKVTEGMTNPTEDFRAIFETYIRHKDGHKVPIEIIGKFLYNEQHELIGIQGTTRDITQRKQVENQREKLLKVLENKNEELESIVYISSHDLRSPLLNISGHSGELRDMLQQVQDMISSTNSLQGEIDDIKELIQEQIPSSLKFISSNTAKMDSLLNGLLKLCRLGRNELEMTPVQMNMLIQELTDSLEYQLRQISGQIQVDSLPDCYSDRNQLLHVLTNLLDNAIKYRHPERNLVVQISGRLKEDHVVYAVSDNGIGIDPKYYKKIFEVFHQLEPATEQQGLGLGLTIVKRIVDRLEGDIWLESIPGEGTTFYVAIPMDRCFI